MWIRENELVELIEEVDSGKHDGYICTECQKKPYQKVLVDHLSKRFELVEKDGNSVRGVHMLPVDYGVLRKWGRDLIHPIGDARRLRKGEMAILWTATIIVSKNWPKGYLLMTDSERYL